jgi:ribonuclease E
LSNDIVDDGDLFDAPAITTTDAEVVETLDDDKPAPAANRSRNNKRNQGRRDRDRARLKTPPEGSDSQLPEARPARIQGRNVRPNLPLPTQAVVPQEIDAPLSDEPSGVLESEFINLPSTIIALNVALDNEQTDNDTNVVSDHSDGDGDDNTETETPKPKKARTVRRGPNRRRPRNPNYKKTENDLGNEDHNNVDMLSNTPHDDNIATPAPEHDSVD